MGEKIYPLVYLASPMASTKSDSWGLDAEKLERNTRIAEILRAAGMDIHLPQDNQKETQKLTQAAQEKIIAECDFMIAILSDTRGIYLEVGFAKGIGKKAYALIVEETRPVSEWLESWFEFVARNIDELIEYLKKKII